MQRIGRPKRPGSPVRFAERKNPTDESVGGRAEAALHLRVLAPLAHGLIMPVIEGAQFRRAEPLSGRDAVVGYRDVKVMTSNGMSSCGSPAAKSCPVSPADPNQFRSWGRVQLHIYLFVIGS